jgi:AraC-like DNA-binding protein
LNLGYSDQAHFVRDFKAVTGISPAAYSSAARLHLSGKHNFTKSD